MTTPGCGRPGERDRQLRTLTTPRSAAAGVVFAGLFSASLILLRSSVPADALTQPEWADGATTLLKIALVLTPFAGIAFLWFVGVVRDEGCDPPPGAGRDGSPRRDDARSGSGGRG